MSNRSSRLIGVSRIDAGLPHRSERPIVMGAIARIVTLLFLVFCLGLALAYIQ